MFSRVREKDPLKALAERLADEFVLGLDSIHGPSHWRRVERYGLYLAEHNGADPMVVRLFALFHDCRRVRESTDRGHGTRGADRARELRHLVPLDEAAFETLCRACEGHTDIIHSKELTVGTCWDADRLDLDRVGVEPDPDMLNTEPAKLLARYDGRSRRRLVL